GFAASGPLSLLITPWLTGALLFLLMLFGLLVVTATPVRRIPERFRHLLSSLMTTDASPSAGVDILDPPAPKTPRQRRRAPKPRTDTAAEPRTHAGDHERPYDTPVVEA